MEKDRVTNVVGTLLMGVACMLLLSVTWTVCPGLPVDETVGQWLHFDKCALLAAGCLLVVGLLKGRSCFTWAECVEWALVVAGAVQAVIGLRQLYGLAASLHSHYALTGTFFNPGPYSGFVAMALPAALHLWLCARKEGQKLYAALAGAAMLLMLCVLPAGMSRSAWIAAAVSCLWVYARHVGWMHRLRQAWHIRRKTMLAVMAGMVCILLLTGGLLFALKPDSARGRLFMWKISCRAIAERPWTGHGAGSFAAAYGNAQETYFATGNYQAWEERVAGTPAYAFNEYLQMAVERGVPLALGIWALVGIGLCVGIRRRLDGVCGAVFSLMVFAFSSYPLQLPAFVVALGLLLSACLFTGGRMQWMILAVLVALMGGARLESDRRTAQACSEWMNARVLYHAGGYCSAERDYHRLYALLKDRPSFMFEFGHCLHKLGRCKESNHILKEALRVSGDPMILNVMGKNFQQMGDYPEAEACFVRSVHRLPGRIYPYYLLAKLYACPEYKNPEKLEWMKRMVLSKDPKVHSTAVEQMREEVDKLGADDESRGQESP